MKYWDELSHRIDSKSVLFFDMDGTLVDTNFANYLSYKDAIKQVMNLDIISYKSQERFNRKKLIEVIPNLTKMDYEKIINLKNKLHDKYLSKTKLNNNVVDILKKYSQTNMTVLVTKSFKERAFMTLEYHKLIDDFSEKFYHQKIGKNNKYQTTLWYLKINPKFVFAFEDEKTEIDSAITAGIPYENIICV